MRALVPGLLAIAALVACDDHLYGTQEAACREENPLTWENFGWGVLDENCNGCHSSHHAGEDRSGAPDGVDFDTWEGVVENAERIYVRTVETETMPPQGGIGPLKRTMIAEWMRCEVFPAAGVQ